LISFPSVSQHSNVEITEHIARSVRGMNPSRLEQLEYRDSDGERKACCVARWGEGSGGLAYFGHTDVVPADDWSGPGGDPFLAVVDGDRIYGRGACDMKGSLAMALAAAQARHGAEFRHPLYLAFTADEEIGYAGARHVAEHSEIFREMVQGQPRAIIGEPTKLRVVHAHKGTQLWRIIARGRAAHSSTGLGRNANLQMIPFLTELKSFYDEAELDPLWKDDRFQPPTLTMNIGLSDRTRAINITPPISVCTVYVRPAPGMDVTPLQNRIRETAEDFGLEFFVERRGSPVWTDPNSEFVRDALALTGCQAAETVCYGTDGCELTALKNMILWGPGDIAQAHTADEWIAVHQLRRGTQLFGTMIDQWCLA
jgi:acetylornithine deacetylase